MVWDIIRDPGKIRIYEGGGGRKCIWRFKEKNKQRDEKNIFTLHIPPWAPHTYDFVVLTSLTHSQKILLVVLQIGKYEIVKAKDLIAPIRIPPGCPKTENKCWYGIGSSSSAGLKKDACRFWSVSIAVAPANTGEEEIWLLYHLVSVVCFHYRIL
jgi:hypothetical protein